MSLADTYRLSDRYLRDDRTVFMTGVQALARLPVEQLRVDRSNNLDTAAFVAGYPGSPLAGLDGAYERAAAIASDLPIHLRPSVNEEYAATAVMGSQLATTRPDARFDGVVGIWYGKAPGVDRASDALRHAMFAGTDPLGGAVALAGDDPAAKSSTIPCSSAGLLADLGMPILFPADPGEALDLGRHAIALSRASGLWVALRIVVDVADGSGTVSLDPHRIKPILPEVDGALYMHRPDGNLLTPRTLQIQQEILEVRLPLAVEYGALNNLNRITVSSIGSVSSVGSGTADSSGGSTGSGDSDGSTCSGGSDSFVGSSGSADSSGSMNSVGASALAGSTGSGDLVVTARPTNDWIGIISAGNTYRELREALSSLGLSSDKSLTEVGIRLLKLGMLWPFDNAIIREFANGLSEIVVVIENKPAVELQVKDALYGLSVRPVVVGQRDEHGNPLIAGLPTLNADGIVPGLRKRLEPRLAHRLRPQPQPREKIAVKIARTPFFCSGCPHNRSTVVDEGTLVGAGIGCHAMVMMGDEARYGDIVGVTCMGSEGAQWIGMSPFVDSDHLVQNLGDGTYFHSGLLAITAAIASGANMTYKLLWNKAVAMTGGQDPTGQLSLERVTRTLLALGVAKVVVTSEDLRRTRALDFPQEVEVLHRDHLLEAQRKLAKYSGVTVLIHDQSCAAELRRARKRRRIAPPKTRVVINHRICEGCGDCAVKSNCLSMQPIETPFGRKTTIDQHSCNFDYSCLDGDCPAFVRITSKPARFWRRNANKNGHQSGVDSNKDASPPPNIPPPPNHPNPLNQTNSIGETGISALREAESVGKHSSAEGELRAEGEPNIAKSGSRAEGRISLAESGVDTVGERSLAESEVETAGKRNLEGSEEFTEGSSASETKDDVGGRHAEPVVPREPDGRGKEPDEEVGGRRWAENGRGVGGVNIRIAGIGGTGVVTAAQIIGTAAMLEGLHVAGLDQTGLSQKAGPVVSDVRISKTPIAGSHRLANGQADLILALDLLVAASPANLSPASSARTAVVGSTELIPPGKKTAHPESEMPTKDELRSRIEKLTRPNSSHWAQAGMLTETLVGDQSTVNTFIIGMATQSGLLGVSPEAIEEAIELNGVAVEANLSAFRWGRWQVADPEVVDKATDSARPHATSLTPLATDPSLPSQHSNGNSEGVGTSQHSKGNPIERVGKLEGVGTSHAFNDKTIDKAVDFEGIGTPEPSSDKFIDSVGNLEGIPTSLDVSAPSNVKESRSAKIQELAGQDAKLAAELTRLSAELVMYQNQKLATKYLGHLAEIANAWERARKTDLKDEPAKRSRSEIDDRESSGSNDEPTNRSRSEIGDREDFGSNDEPAIESRSEIDDREGFGTKATNVSKATPSLSDHHPSLSEHQMKSSDCNGDGVAEKRMKAEHEVERAYDSERSTLLLTSTRGLFKLMAYKDEYEVARLMRDSDGQAAATAHANPGDRVAWMLLPPTLKALGRSKKIAVSSRWGWCFAFLSKAKSLRGTPLDIFGWSKLRQIERSLPNEYLAAINASLTTHGITQATRVAEAADLVRGFESVKLANVERFRQHLTDLTTQRTAKVDRPPPP